MHSVRFQDLFQRVVRRSSPPGRTSAGDAAKLVAETGFEPSRDVSVSVHEEGLTLLNTRTGRVFTSNRTGAQIWKRLEQHATVDAVASEISREYHLDHATALDHARRFVAELQNSGLVRPRVSQ
jgi:hypothetical protein